MKSAKEKISNMASAAKEHVDLHKAKVEEKLEKAAASTEEEKKIAEERRKAKEAEAKKELHEAKARHAAEKLSHKQAHLRHHGHAASHPTDPPLYGETAAAATAATAAPVYGENEPVVGTHGHYHGATAPTDPLGTQLQRNKRL